jgi:peptidoglycan pentaglycine glycine transferase (the first glycine)
MVINYLEKEEYENFIRNLKPISFLQNFLWGEVEKKLKREVLRLGFFINNEIIGICQLIGYKAKRGNFLALPHGPLLKENNELIFINAISSLIDFLKKNRFNKKYNFLRANFLIEDDEKLKEKLFKLGWKLSPRWFVSENFWIKNLEKDEEELLNEMSKHHRKLILESLEKDYIEIEETNDLEKIKIFLDLYHKMAENKKFLPYSDDLIKNEFEIFSKENKAILFLGKTENKYYSAAIVIFENGMSYYHHGASIPTKEPINYKMHWYIIKKSKELKNSKYNFWGITLKGEKHPWYGLTKFKQGFGGEIVKLMPTMDYVLNYKYYFTYLYEKIFSKNK